MNFDRRQFLHAAGAAALTAPSLSAAKLNSTFSGVPLGAQSYSFRDRDLDGCVAAMKEIGLGVVELWSGHVEPKIQARGKEGREEIRKWRLEVPLEEIKAKRDKLKAAGIEIYAFNYSFREDFTDEEIDRGFVIAKALGAKCITASSNVSTAKRIAPAATKHKMLVGMHNHSRIVDNEFATAADFTKAMEAGKYIGVNLDIGHFTAANFDAVKYLGEHHAHITTLHIKDRKKDQGPNVVFGEGDTPIKETLLLLKSKGWKIPAMIEFEYKATDTVAEVKKCFDFCKRILTA